MRDKQLPRRFSSGLRQRLVLGGLAAVGVSLGGCSSAPEDVQFKSVSECTTAGVDLKLCEASYNAALLEHQKSAPQFKSLAACQAEWGDNSCAPMATSGYGGSSIFVPLVAGFILSRAMQQRYYDNGGSSYYGGYYGGGSPIYRNRSGANVTVSNSGGRTMMSPVNAHTATVARSGFGGMGMSRGGFGG